MTMGEFKDFAEGISSVMSTLAIIIGGVWAYWKFVVQMEREPRAEFDLTAEFIGIQDGKWLLEVSARLANKGKVRHLMKNATMNIRYLTSADHVLESSQDGHFRQVSFPHSIGRRVVWSDSYIDPGLEFRNSYLAWVPEEATFVLLLCNFEYDRGVWPAQRALKVPNFTNPRVEEIQEMGTAMPGELANTQPAPSGRPHAPRSTDY
jgi:hypothetical protein